MNNKIKVIHIITKLELGGAQKNTLYTVLNLSEKFDVKLITGTGGILDEYARKNLGKKVIFLGHLVREISPLKDLIAFLKITAILSKEKPTIIHTHSSKAGIIGRLAGFFARIPIIIHTYHGFGFNPYQSFFVRNFYIFLEKIASFISDAVIFVSRNNIETAKRYKITNTKKTFLIRSGIKLNDFTPRKDRSFIKSYAPEYDEKKHTVICTVANLKVQKNPMDFFKVAEEILKRRKDVFFIYAGGGSENDIKFYTKIIKEKKINNNCFLTGWVDNVASVYSSCDIFILTSLWEGLPRSLIEAMKSGLVPVCYKTDGVADVIKDGINGFLLEQKDVDGMVKKIEELISDKTLLLRIRENVINSDLSEFDIDEMVKKQEKLYLSLIK